ncbi:MAG: hypothetical protein RL172_3323 [Bacteroidota bacterium]|jgi:TonB family protein
MRLHKLLLLVLFNCIVAGLAGQEVVNLLYVGDNGLVDDFKEAHSVIVIKQYPNNHFERLDYLLGAPLTMLRTYNDSTLKNLDGPYLQYHPSGMIQVKGQYSRNTKTGEWWYYNDTGKVEKKEFYEQGIIQRSENPDSVEKKETIKYGDEREADMVGGKNAWQSYLLKKMQQTNGSLSELKGKILVQFTINTSGKLVDIFLKRSANFGLDEEALKIIRNAPDWKPAFQNGQPINAYRVQPFTYLGYTE